MSGVYIPGFKKPVACWHCALLNKDEERCPLHDDWYLSLKDEYEECPLVEVPDHGDLIDAQEQMRLMKACEYDTYNDYSRAFDMLDDAPTIIPEDREEKP